MKGCKSCPALSKCKVTYRGSACAALRFTYGLEDDPEIKTNADRIRAMSDEELPVVISRRCINTLCDIVCGEDCKAFATLDKTSQQRCTDIVLGWLQQPAEGE